MHHFGFHAPVYFVVCCWTRLVTTGNNLELAQGMEEVDPRCWSQKLSMRTMKKMGMIAMTASMRTQYAQSLFQL